MRARDGSTVRFHGLVALGLVSQAALAGCIETGGPPDKSVSYFRSPGTFAAGDYEAPAMPTPGTSQAGSATDVKEGASGNSAAQTPASVGGRGSGGGASGGAATSGSGGAGGALLPGDGSMGVVDQAAPVKPTGPAEAKLTVKFTSTDMRGRYSPRNCGAVWIETKSSEFVKTIERWCGIRAYYLRRWTEASGGWGGGRGFFGGGGSMEPSPDQVDAISAGTLRMHVAHESTWNMHDGAGELLPDGEYKLVIEVSDGTAQTIEVPFTKGYEPMQAMPPDADPVTGLMVDYAPVPAP